MPSVLIVLFIVLVCLVLYLALKSYTPSNIDKRFKSTRPTLNEFSLVECADEEPEKEPPKPKKVTPGDNKETRLQRLARLHADMLVRSDKKLTEFQEDRDTVKLCISSVFYNKDADGHPEIVVISEFSDESTAFYYAAVDKTKDAFFVFERAQAKDLMLIFNRQNNR